MEEGALFAEFHTKVVTTPKQTIERKLERIRPWREIHSYVTYTREGDLRGSRTQPSTVQSIYRIDESRSLPFYSLPLCQFDSNYVGRKTR